MSDALRTRLNLTVTVDHDAAITPAEVQRHLTRKLAGATVVDKPILADARAGTPNRTVKGVVTGVAVTGRDR